MIKTPLSTVIGGAFWTQGAVQIGSMSTGLLMWNIVSTNLMWNAVDSTPMWQQ